jgi:hypothetical protein
MNEDKAFLDTLDADALLIMKGKKIASLNALRRKVNWPDDDILDQVFRGKSSEVGRQAPVPGFDQELTLPSCSVTELRLNSCWSNKAMSTRTRSCGCPSTDQSFWEAQLAEVARDWLRGPLSIFWRKWPCSSVKPHMYPEDFLKSRALRRVALMTSQNPG